VRTPACHSQALRRGHATTLRDPDRCRVVRDVTASAAYTPVAAPRRRLHQAGEGRGRQGARGAHTRPVQAYGPPAAPGEHSPPGWVTTCQPSVHDAGYFPGHPPTIHVSGTTYCFYSAHP
jgi:hypothetical protein